MALERVFGVESIAELGFTDRRQRRHASSAGNGNEDVRRSDFLRGLYAWEVDNDVRRRDFGKLAAVAGAAVVTEAWEFGEHIGSPDVQRLLAGVDALEAQDQHVGGGTLVQFAAEQLARAKHTLDTGTYDTDTGDAFASATGHLAVQAGWIAYDASLHPLARRCYADALALATESNDEDLIAHACLNGANQSIALTRTGQGSAHHALKLINRARNLMHGRPPGRIHALIAGREAQARGVLGDRTGFCRAIAAAWREVDQALTYEPAEESPQWLLFVTHSEIRGHEARGWGDIGDWYRSVDLFDIAIQEEAGTRNAVHTRAWAAAAQARLGDVRTAIDVATPVLDQLETIASTRTLRVLDPVRSAADVAIGGEFYARFDNLAISMGQKAITA